MARRKTRAERATAKEHGKPDSAADSSLWSQYPWAEAWTETIEQSSTFSDEVLRAGARLNRSRPFSDLEVSPGLISGRVEHRGSSYTAQLGVAVLEDSAWKNLVERLGERPTTAVALLVGELPGELADVEGLGFGLLPSVSELYPDCNCGDWNGLCGHAPALLYKVADLIEADPFVLTTLRGKGRYELKAMVESARTFTDTSDQSPRSCRLDEGVSAAAAYRRTVVELPSPRRLPLKVGEPLTVTVPPPVDSGVRSEDIQNLVEAASRRAWHLLAGQGSP